MTRSQSVQTCRWGMPTLFLQWPFWYEASENEWSCTRGAEPRGIADARRCETCGAWMIAPRPVAAPHHEDDHLGGTRP
jgi:hypothetical protein